MHNEWIHDFVISTATFVFNVSQTQLDDNGLCALWRYDIK